MANAEREIEVTAAGPGGVPVQLPGTLTVAGGARGAILFAHGSGSSRHSPRNRMVAGVLQGSGFATLLFDLLTPEEETDRRNVFDIGLLAARLAAATRSFRQEGDVGALPVGYFGASTGAAAAVVASVEVGGRIHAVVSRGGRPDLAETHLPRVTAPTLLIVGGEDHAVLDMNRAAQRLLRCENDLAVVPGATHLFEEEGALDRVARLAARWFDRHVRRDDGE